jgi:multicomponent Na+:H+ antiporter subunit B
MTGLWMRTPGRTAVELGTPVLFDLGVFLVVMGATLGVIFSLSEER